MEACYAIQMLIRLVMYLKMIQHLVKGEMPEL